MREDKILRSRKMRRRRREKRRRRMKRREGGWGSKRNQRMKAIKKQGKRRRQVHKKLFPGGQTQTKESSWSSFDVISWRADCLSHYKNEHSFSCILFSCSANSLSSLFSLPQLNSWQGVKGTHDSEEGGGGGGWSPGISNKNRRGEEEEEGRSKTSRTWDDRDPGTSSCLSLSLPGEKQGRRTRITSVVYFCFSFFVQTVKLSYWLTQQQQVE